MKAYLIFDGAWDPAVLAVFTDKEMAEEGLALYRKFHGHDEASMEEFDLNPSLDALKREEDAWDVTIFLTSGHAEAFRRPLIGRTFGGEDPGFCKFVVYNHDAVATSILAPDRETAILRTRLLLDQPKNADVIAAAKTYTHLRGLSPEHIAGVLNTATDPFTDKP